MFKKINLVIVSFFSVLTINYQIAYYFYLPIILFYSLKDFRNSFFCFGTSLIAIIFFARAYLISYLVLMGIIALFIIVLQLLASKPTNKITNQQLRLFICGFVVIANYLLGMIFFPSLSYLQNGILSLISVVLYIFFEFNLLRLIKNSNETIHGYSIGYMEVLIYLIATLGATSLSIYSLNVGVLLGMFYAMLLSKKYQNIYFFMYSIIASLGIIFFNKELIGLFIPIIGAFYLLPSMYAFATFNIFITLTIFANTTYSQVYLLSFMILSVLFEIFSPLIVKEKLSKNNEFEYIYSQVMRNVNNEILSFSHFLDHFITVFQNPKDYNEKISDSIKLLIHNNCNNCEKQKECFATYKVNLYPIFKNILTGEKNETLTYLDLKKSCNKLYAIETMGKTLGKKIDFSKADCNNNGLIAQIAGVSNAIKKYAIELMSKQEISYYLLNDLKYRIVDYGLDLVSFEIKKVFKHDFLIEVGIKKKEKLDDNVINNIIDTIKVLSENTLKERLSVVYKQDEKESYIFNIIPEININVIYGYGSLSSEKNTICGDNYFVKDLGNGKLIAAISDGMGKGYSAFCESNITLQLVDDVTNLNIDSTTSLEILNSFYAVQDYFERYATLDLIEINRYLQKATFYKMGGTTSYIIHQNGNIEQIINKNLPFGIDEEVNKKEVNLHEGDLILMSSDGIFENIQNEQALIDYFSSIKTLPPQKIVYELINYTLKQDIKTSDDMSIIALKITKAA